MKIDEKRGTAHTDIGMKYEILGKMERDGT